MCNRKVSRVIANAMNDCSFSDLTGAEIIDQMGLWRGGRDGFPVYGGPLWCDFENINHSIDTNETQSGDCLLTTKT